MSRMALDSRTEVPAEMTSSTITSLPCSGAPTTDPPSPWSLASLRLKLQGTSRPLPASAMAMLAASGIPL